MQVIGAALLAHLGGRGHRAIAADLGLPADTGTRLAAAGERAR